MQFYIKSLNNGATTNNGEYHSVNINGPCSARLVSYVFDHNNSGLFQIQSDVFKVPYSSSTVNGSVNLNQGLVLSNTGVFPFDQSHRDYHWNNIVIPGRVQWTVLNTAGQPFSGTWNLILTFDIEQLP